MMARMLSFKRSWSERGVRLPRLISVKPMAEQTQVNYNLPHSLGETCLVVTTGRSLLNFFPGYATSSGHGAVATTPSAQHVTQVAESRHHIKHSAAAVHLHHGRAIYGSSFTPSPEVDKVCVGP